MTFFDRLLIGNGNVIKCLFLFFIFYHIGFNSNAQTVDCINVQEVNIPFNTSDYETNNEDSYNYNLIYYADEDEYSFWYKININQDCNFKFSVLPSNPDDDYDFMLFKYANLDFCEALVQNTVLPLNINLYEPKTTKEGPTVYIANQKEIPVKKGEVYYISVMNIIGEDCGHQLYIESCNSSIIINSVNKPCFKFNQPKNDAIATKSDKTKEISEQINEIIEDEYTLFVEDSVSVRGFVRDNDDGKKIDAEIVFEDDVTGELFNFKASAIEGFNITLERSRRYRLQCGSLGYYNINGVIEFLKPSTYDFYLLKVKEGQNFVMKNIFFYPSTYALNEESFQELDKLSTYLELNPFIKIQIQGHTAGNNPVRSTNPSYKGMGDEWNYIGSAKKLSKLRAQQVQNYLTEKGVIENRLSIVGFGADNKLIENPINNEEKRQNMRVEIKVTQREETSTEYTPSSLD